MADRGGAQQLGSVHVLNAFCRQQQCEGQARQQHQVDQVEAFRGNGQVFSVSCVVYLAQSAPWLTASYALFCCAGFCTLAGYWWLVERK